jgi:FkbM family methyltransferase
MKRRVRAAAPAWLYRWYRRWRVRSAIRHFEPRVVAHTYAGHPLRLLLADPLGEGWYDHDWPDQMELEQLRASRLRPGARVFDLGAHQAVVALILGRIVGPEGAVLAVEAEPHNAEIALRNVELNEAGHVTVLNAAVSDVAGTLRFAAGLNGSVDVSASRSSVVVPAVTIDGLAEEHGTPDVVLLDLEGWEAHALQGAGRVLQDGVTDFLIELHAGCGLEESGSTVDDVLEPLRAAGYRLTVAEASDAEAPLVFAEPSPDEAPSRRSYVVAFARTSP